MKVKGILEVIKEINNIKKRGLIKDYAIGGGIAKNYYLEPQFTYDLDVFILINTMNDFHNLYDYFSRKKYKIANVYIVIHDIPVQFLPSFIQPFIKDGIKKSKSIKLNGVKTKILTTDYLIATLLMSFRQKDKYAIKELLTFVNKQKLEKLLKKNSSKTYPLYKRFHELAGKR